MIPALIRQCSDPTYFTKRELPPPIEIPAEEKAASSLQPDAEGWVVACTDDEVPPGEMLRFDVGPRTFVVYHAEVSSLPLR